MKKWAGVTQGSKKVLFGRAGQVSFHPQLFSEQVISLPTKSVKGRTNTCPGLPKFKSYWSKGQAGIEDFF